MSDTFETLLETVHRLTIERDEAGYANLMAERAENKLLRGLIECNVCGDELGDGPPHGWLAGLCPGCQAEIMAEREKSDG